jgi:hypothetical protein
MKVLKSITKFFFKTDEKQVQRQVITPKPVKFRKPNHIRKSSF